MHFIFLILLYLVLGPNLNCEAQERTEELTNSIGIKFVRVNRGTFRMGSPLLEPGRREHERSHRVTINEDFFIGITEVTQSQYLKLMGNNPSYFQKEIVEEDSSNHPVDRVSWENAQEFCERLSGLREEKHANRSYRLPTQEEWEYACRAGSKSAFSFGRDVNLLEQYAWYWENGYRETHPVAQKKPNAWGIYDMHGNVFELCQDREALPLPEELFGKRDSVAYITKIRGGSFASSWDSCRSANSNVDFGDGREIGFRVVLTMPKE